MSPPRARRGGGNMAAVHLAHAVGGSLMLGFVSAVAFATILAVVAGLALAGASAVSHDVYANHICRGQADEKRDAWGGDAERRMRFPLAMVRAVRAAWPDHKPLGVRLPGRDFIDGGLTIEDAVVLGRQMRALGVDYLTPSIGLLDSKFRAPKVEPGYMVPFAERLRHGTGGPVMATGMIVSPHQAEAVVQEGRADMVAMGRAFLNDPRWGWHAAAALGGTAAVPRQYSRGAPGAWPGYKIMRPPHPHEAEREAAE